MSETSRPIGFGTKLAFGIGQVAEGVKNNAFATFVLIYYNQVLGVPGSLAGLAIFIALCFDAVTDPIAGSVSDNLRSRWGRRHPFMYASALPLALAFYLLFAPPDGLSEMQLFFWLTGFAVLTRGAMTLYHVPHLALGAELSDDYETRTSIVSYRTLFGYLGSVGTFVIGFTIFFVDRDGTKGNLIAESYPPFALTCAVIMLITIWWSALGTHDQIAHLKRHEPDEAPPLSLSRTLLRVFADLREAVGNYSFRWLFLGVIIVFVMVGVQSALGLYMANYFWELNSLQLLALVLANPVGIILGAMLTAPLNHRFDKKTMVVAGTAWFALFQLTPPILRLLGWFPENGDPMLMTILVGFSFIGGVGVVQALVSAGSMMADIADEHELQTRRRQEGIFFGALSFSGKAASGVGNLIGGFGLDIIAFPIGAEPGGVASDVLVRLGLLYGPVVMVFAVVAVWCYSHYRLTRHRHEEILVALRQRRQERDLQRTAEHAA